MAKYNQLTPLPFKGLSLVFLLHHVFCVVLNSSNSAEMRASVVASQSASGVDATDLVAVTDTVYSTESSDRQTGTKVANTLTSSVTVMIGHSENVAANSDIVSLHDGADMQHAVSTSVTPQISATDDGSIILTVSYSPLTTAVAASDGRPSVRSAGTELAESGVNGTAAGEPSDSGVLSAGPSADNVTESSVIHRFDDCICLLLCLHLFYTFHMIHYFQSDNLFSVMR